MDSQLKTAKDELIVYLKEIFGITFISNEMWDIKVNEDEKAKLTEVLSYKKDHDIIGVMLRQPSFFVLAGQHWQRHTLLQFLD